MATTRLVGVVTRVNVVVFAYTRELFFVEVKGGKALKWYGSIAGEKHWRAPKYPSRPKKRPQLQTAILLP